MPQYNLTKGLRLGRGLDMPKRESIWDSNPAVRKAGALIRIPSLELMGLWGELVEALHGVNGYGGDTAEIYSYRLSANCPAASSGVEGAKNRQAQEAGDALWALCNLFSSHYECEVTIDGHAPDVWANLPSRFGRRAHVRVAKQKEKPEPRDLAEVIEDVLLAVPDSCQDLRSDLEHVLGKVPYTAPEAMYGRWLEVHLILQSGVGMIEPGWKQEVADIFAGRKDPE